MEDFKENSNQVILILDNWEELFFQFFNILRYDKSEFLLQFLRDLYILSNSTSHSSLTSFILEKNNTDLEKESSVEYKSIQKEIISLSASTLHLNNPEIKYSQKNTIFGLETFFYDSKCQNKIYKSLQYKLFNLLTNLKNKQSQDQKFKEFKIEREIWDRFEILDSQYYLPIFLTNRIFNFEQQILLVNFLISTIKNGFLTR